MTKAVVLGLALIAAAFIGRGYIEQAQADEGKVKQWAAFIEEVRQTRRAVHLAQAALEAGGWRQDECRFQSLQRPTWTPLEEQLTAECALRHFGPVDGGYTRLYSVIDCESHWNRLASNAGRYLGLAQHAAAYWPGRVSSMLPEDWRIGPWQRWQNSRSQLIVTVKMARSSWNPWSCA